MAPPPIYFLIKSNVCSAAPQSKVPPPASFSVCINLISGYFRCISAIISLPSHCNPIPLIYFRALGSLITRFTSSIRLQLSVPSHNSTSGSFFLNNGPKWFAMKFRMASGVHRQVGHCWREYGSFWNCIIEMSIPSFWYALTYFDK